MDQLPHPMLIACAALIGWIVYLFLVRDKIQDRQFESVASQLGLQYFAEGEPTILNELWHLRMFNQGHSRQVTDMCCGRVNGIDVAIFNYEYSTGGSDDRQVHTNSVICLQSWRLKLPVFELLTRGVQQKAALGYYKIEIDRHTGFASRCVLRAPEEEPVVEYLSKKMLKGLASQSGVSIEANRGWLVLNRVGHPLRPQDVRILLRQGLKVYHLLRGEQKK